MDGFRQWAAAVCAAAIVCTLLQRLFPDNSLGRQGKLLLSCLFMCVLLSPALGGDVSVALPNLTQPEHADTAALEAHMRGQLVCRVNETLLDMVNQALAGYGWEAKKVVTDMDIAEDGSISMGQIVVYVDENTARRATAVKQVAEKRLGTAVTVAVWEEHG